MPFDFFVVNFSKRLIKSHIQESYLFIELTGSPISFLATSSSNWRSYFLSSFLVSSILVNSESFASRGVEMKKILILVKSF